MSASSKIPVGHRTVPKYADVKAGFREEVPPSSTRNDGLPAFFSSALCHIGLPARLFVMDDTPQMPSGHSSRSDMEIELSKLSSPRIFLVRMLVFLVLCALVMVVLYKQIITAFFA